MKILSIRAKNIASLKGDIFVDFSQKHFADAGLFAITGKTGAGKTSLLDAITVGLYGYTARCSKNTPEDIMSKFTGEAWSEVEFEIKGKRYRSKWGIHRSRKQIDGTIQPPKMELVDLSTGNILEEKLNEVRNKVEEITGLDYEKFLQTVMLSQGEFAKFLKANSKEKSALLEKITGSTIYSELSQLAHQKEKEEREKLQELKREIDEEKLLSPELQNEMEKQIVETELKLKTLTEEEDRISTQIGWLGQIDQKRNELDSCKERLLKAKEDQEQLATEVKKLELHQKTLPFQADLGRLYNLKTDCANAQKALSDLEAQLPDLFAKKEESASLLEKAKNAYAAADQKYKDNRPKIRQAAELESQRNQLREKYRVADKKISDSKSVINAKTKSLEDCTSKLNVLTSEMNQCVAYRGQYIADEHLVKELSAIEAGLKNYSSVIQDLHQYHSLKQKHEQNKVFVQQELEKQAKAIEEIEASLKNFIEAGLAEDEKLQKLLDGKNVHEVRNALELSLNARPLWEEKKKLYTAYKLNQERLQKLDYEVTDLEKTQEREKLHIENLKKDLEMQREKLLAFQELYDKELMIQSMVEHRALLKEGEACPLCGSKEHPFADYNSEKKTSEARQKKDAQEQMVQSLSEAVNELVNKISVISNTLQHLKENQKELQRHVNVFQNDFALLNQKTRQKLDISNIELIEAGLHKVDHEIKINKEILAEYENLQKHKDELAQNVQQQKDLKEKTHRILTEKRSDSNLISSNLEQTVTQISKCEGTITALSNELSTILKKYDLSIPEVEVMPQWLHYVKTRADKFTATIQRISQLEVEMLSVKGDIRVLKEAIAAADAAVKEFSVEQQEITIEGMQLKNAIEVLIGNKNSADFEKELQEQLEKSAQEREKTDQICRLADNAYAEKLTQKKAASALYNSRKQQLDDLQKQLEEKAGMVGFTGLSSLEAAVLSPKEEESIQSRKAFIDKALIEINSEIASKEKDLKVLLEKKLTSKSAEDLLDQKAALKEQRDLLSSQLAELRHRLKVNEGLIEQFGKVKQEIEKQQKEYAKWAMLDNIIGSSRGDEFREFAQGLTLSHLLVQANRQLIKLNDRYLLKKVEGKDLDIEIIDRHQADVTRPIHTLSGGETFLVSLSLALGLCDLAAKNLTIDTLFIDEGFGTLDSETLDTAITTLENLRAGGKLVGIISHVDTLKERITTQIQIIKTSGGVSELVLKY